MRTTDWMPSMLPSTQGLRVQGMPEQEAGPARRPLALPESAGSGRPPAVLRVPRTNDGRTVEAEPLTVSGPMADRLRIGRRKRIALIAHDNRKLAMLEWAREHRELLARHDLFATGTTGHILASELGLDVTRFQSGPLGGDQQVGAKITEGAIDFAVFFWDPLEPHPHDVDVKALLRIAVVYNIPIACNRATADFLVLSPLMDEEYHRAILEEPAERAMGLSPAN